jgi:hypothetical protein
VLLNYGGWQAGLVREVAAGIVTWGLPEEQAAWAIATALGDKTWLQRAGANARSLAERQFDRDRLAAGLERVLVAAAASKGELAQALCPGKFASPVRENLDYV